MSEREELGRPQATPTLREVGRTRAGLHRALVQVERKISSPARGREESWAKEVRISLEELRRALDEHIEVTERVDGLYAEITARAPRLAGKIERLAAEHPEMRDATAALIERLESTPIGQPWPLDDARDDLQRLLGRLVRHRQRGADLVWEAYNLDIGGIE